MKRKFFISAIYISPPNTMGGNTKIMLELINNLCDNYDFIVFTTEPETFRRNVRQINKITIIDIPYNFAKFNYLKHLNEVNYIYTFYKNYLNVNKIDNNDYFYSASDFGPDVLPIYKLKKEYRFKWVASLYLFIPNPYENLVKKYKFPFLKYSIYWLYQKYIFSKILERFDLCLITNHNDIKYFSNNRKNEIFPIYGGVNTEQIENAKKDSKQIKKYDAIFCSRLHPQKGISQFLDIWKLVITKQKNAKLGIMGNGSREFEDFLKEKAKKLNIAYSLKWFGYVGGEEKYRLYLQSKVFSHSTIYDNNGMVAAEALCSGLPVIMYDLDKLKFYDDGCIKIKVGDKIQYSEEILRLIKDRDYYNKTKPSLKAIDKLKKIWKWENRMSVFKFFLENYEKNIN